VVFVLDVGPFRRKDYYCTVHLKISTYFEYDGDRDVNDKGLTIGGYESAWLAYLVAAFVLENTGQFFNEAVYNGIYRDYGLVVSKGNWSKQEITKWLDGFQAEVNKITKYDGLQFTVSI
jgi:hypothetical protein